MHYRNVDGSDPRRKTRTRVTVSSVRIAHSASKAVVELRGIRLDTITVTGAGWRIMLLVTVGGLVVGEGVVVTLVDISRLDYVIERRAAQLLAHIVVYGGRHVLCWALLIPEASSLLVDPFPVHLGGTRGETVSLVPAVPASAATWGPRRAVLARWTRRQLSSTPRVGDSVPSLTTKVDAYHGIDRRIRSVQCAVTRNRSFRVCLEG